ncbi:MAG TPA: hypothetical protein VMS22_02450 [Candidatus Eisenbacteria bacterium]|nr:hypothetical protein [Candidatus Eisenbacteria bacterium]
MERRADTRCSLASIALAIGVTLAAAGPAGAVGYASFLRREVGMRAAEAIPAPSRRRSAAPRSTHQRGDENSRATNPGHGPMGGNALLAQQHDGRSRRRMSDSRLTSDPRRSRPYRAGRMPETAGERLVAGSGAVFHDAHAPPALATFGSDAAGHRA